MTVPLQRAVSRPHVPIPVRHAPDAQPVLGQRLLRLPLNKVMPDPTNPRKSVGDVSELAQSIQRVGLLQPIIVREGVLERKLVIVAGARRFAAVKSLGWTHIPAILRREMSPDHVLAAMVVENDQRVALDPIEEARAFKSLVGMGHTQREVAALVGRSEFHVSTRLQLLHLPLKQQEAVRTRQMTLREAYVRTRVVTKRAARPRQSRAWHFDHTHPLAELAQALCVKGSHNRGRYQSGGVACGQCWESVIRGDERLQAGEQAP